MTPGNLTLTEPTTTGDTVTQIGNITESLGGGTTKVAVNVRQGTLL